MARNGSGTYSLPAGNPVTTGAVISSTWANNTLDDIATALTASLAKDGQTTPTANLPMATYKHTGVGTATATTDYARADQVQNSSMEYLASVAGTDTITATATPTPAAYATGQTFRFIPANTNTGAATINVSSLGAKSITKNGSTALAAGDLTANKLAVITYDGTRFQLLNPAGGTGDFLADGSVPMTGSLTLGGAGTGVIFEGTTADANETTLVAGEPTADRTITLPDETGTVALNGTTRKQSLYIPATAMTSRTTNGAAAGTGESTTNKVMRSTLDFDTATIEYAQFSVRMPKSWDESTVTAAYTWTANSTSTNSVSWALQGIALSDDDNTDTAYGTAVQVTDANKATAYDINITAESSAITIGGTPAAEDWVSFQVYRDVAGALGGTDDLAVDALLLGVTLYYNINTLTDA